MKRKALLVLFILALLILGVFLQGMLSRGPQEVEAPTLPSKTVTPGALPTPTQPGLSDQNLKQEVISELPFSSNEFTIEYFPRTDLFFINVKNPPFKEGKDRALAWFRERGLDPSSLKIEWLWGTSRGTGPSQ